jgi:hypothetical protein
MLMQDVERLKTKSLCRRVDGDSIQDRQVESTTVVVKAKSLCPNVPLSSIRLNFLNLYAIPARMLIYLHSHGQTVRFSGFL